MSRSSSIPVVGRSYGLIAGRAPVLCSVAAHTSHALTAASTGEEAELSAQNPSSRSRAPLAVVVQQG